MSDIAAKLDEARALIEKGWCQDIYRDWLRPGPATPHVLCFCALGAIAEATGSRECAADGTDEAAALAKVLPGEGTVFEVISRWNDMEGRTQAEVIEAFRKAAELARAEAQ